MVPENDSQLVWFALSAPFRRELDAKKQLDVLAVENFVPMRYKVVSHGGKKERKLLPAVNNLIFVRANKSAMREIKKRVPSIQYLMRTEDKRNIPIVVPDGQMRQFIAVCKTHNEKLVFLTPNELDIQKGTPVRVIGGAFDGVEGVFIKVKGIRSKRVVVLLSGLTAVAIAEIQPDLIEVLNR